MKKNLYSLLVAIVAATMSLSAQTVVIDDGFENGIQEDVWTQEFVSGHMAWAVESEADGLAYPATTVQGTHRAYLRNTTGEGQGYVTRLVSKVMDLSPRVIFQPELSFWYANPRWGAYCDTLRVLYRTDANAKWKKLGTYANVSKWEKVTLELPELTSTYQIAFEGIENMGRGIVLDSIKLRSAPDCTVPHHITASNKGFDRVKISWNASYDSEFFELIVSKDSIDPYKVEEADPSRIAYHDRLNGRQKNITLTLTSGEYYYVYVRSICEREISVWSNEINPNGHPDGFRVRATKFIPYTCDFNYPNTQTQDVEWTWANNIEKATPYVYSTTNASELAKYSKSKTPAVVFSGGTASSTNTTAPKMVIPAGKCVYLATPTLTDTMNANFSLSQCQVRFWSTVHQYTGRLYGHSLIVGVMDDPDDITSFKPVDTVSVWGYGTHVENIVDLSSYRGTGAYVAFMSKFIDQNLFYIDDVTIEYRPQVQKVTKIYVNPRDTYADISWEGNAPSYNVLITSAEVDPSNPAASAIVAQATVNTNSYHCAALEPNHSWNRPYYVYVQAVGAEWSYRYPFVTVASKRTLPFTFDFEAASGTYKINNNTSHPTGIGVFGNNPSYPNLSTSKHYKGSQCLYLDKNIGTDSWITLPMVDKLDSTQVKFYLSGPNSYSQAHATIGVMSNPMDINTFIPVADFTLNTPGFSMCYANFQKYQGPEGVIAIVWSDVVGMTQKTINYIDELRVEELAECLPPANVALEVEFDSITLSWDASREEEWEAVISTKPLTTAQKELSFAEVAALNSVVYADTLTWSNLAEDPVLGIGGLQSQVEYYLYVRTLCHGDMAWWTEFAFRTPCPDAQFPFKEDFESYSNGATQIDCWQLKNYQIFGVPKVVNKSGSNYLQLWSTAQNQRSVAILPPVEGELSSRLLSFKMRSNNNQRSVLYVGTMRDINDANTFVPFETVYCEANDTNHVVRLFLAKYNLVYDNIAFTTGLGQTLSMSSDVLIDNVEVRDTSCTEAFDFQITDLQTTSFDISWSGASPDKQWKVKVLKTELPLAMVQTANYPASVAVISDSLVIGNALHVEGLNPVHTYYVYIRPICEELWNTTSVKTSCALLDPNHINKETFESYPNNGQADCWTARNAYIYDNSGNKYYSLSSSAAAGDNRAYIASPEIDCKTMSELTVSFSFGSSKTCSMVVGVMTNPANLKSFVALDTMICQNSLTPLRLELSEYANRIPSEARYFAWTTLLGEANVGFCVDDVAIERLTCPLSKPNYSNLSAHSVRINNGSGLNNDWALLITNRPIPSLDSLRSATYEVPKPMEVLRTTVSTSFRDVTELEYDKQYYVYTATLCDDGVSLWSNISFRTPCAAEVPEDLGTITFAGGRMKCWTVGSKTPNAPSYYIPSIQSSKSIMHKGNNYLQIHDEFSESVACVGAYAIMQELDVDLISKYQVNFWGRGYSESHSSTKYNSQIIVGVVTDPNDLSTFVAADTVSLNSSWEPYSISLERYQGDYMGNRGRYVMFLSEFGKTNYAYLSEISVTRIPNCRPINYFSVDSIGEYSAVVSWIGTQESYRLLLADRELEEYEKANYHYLLDSIVNHSDSVLINGLNPSANYYLYVQGICGKQDSSTISLRYAAFRTECPIYAGMPLPFFDDFESYADKEKAPGCWLFRNDHPDGDRPCIEETTTDPAIPEALRPKSALLASNGAGHSWIVAPKMEERLQNLHLSFDIRPWRSSEPATFYVGTMSDPDDLTTFVPIETFVLPADEKFMRHEMMLADYDLPYKNLAFASSTDTASKRVSWVYLDNVRLESYATCHTPKLKVVEARYSTAELELIPAVDGDNQWEIVVVADSAYNQIADIYSYLDTTHTAIRVDNVHPTISGLQPATTYYVYARTLCGGDDVSVWSKHPLELSTRYYYGEGYFFGFEKSEPWQRSMYSTGDNYYIHPALQTGRDNLGNASTSVTTYPYSVENTSALLYAYTGAGALSMQSTTEYFGSYVIFPPAEDAHAGSFEFKVRPASIRAATNMSATSYNAKLEIGVVDKDKGFETYQVLATIDIDKLDGTSEATAENHYLYNLYTLDLDSATIATKQLVLHAPKQPEAKSYLYIDDVELGAAKGYSLVSFNRIVVGGDHATVTWADFGGPWNLYITTENGGQIDTVARYYDLRTTSQLVEGLEAQTYYTAILEAADVPAGIPYTTSASRKFMTACRALEPTAQGDFYWDFDDPTEWEPGDVLEGRAYDSLYLKPACFGVGVPYLKPVNGYQWTIQQKGCKYENPGSAFYANYEIGRGNTNAMRIYTDSKHLGSYLVLPELNCDFDTMMIEFYGRCFANYDEDCDVELNRGKIVDDSYLGWEYSRSMVVGTLTDPNDFESLKVIDTVAYRLNPLTAPSNVNDDPSGLRYWEQMQLPLTGARGKYIVLFQPSDGLFFMDDLSIKPIGNTLFAPTSLHVDAVTATTADLSWHVWNPSAASVIVVLDAAGNEVLREVVTDDVYSIDGLSANSSYQAYVYQTDGVHDGQPSASVYFATECVAITPDYTCGFEAAEGWTFVPNQLRQSAMQSLCWTYGDAANDGWTASYDAENIRDTESHKYSYAGAYAVLLRGENISENVHQPYIAMPAMDVAAYDTLQVTFRMRPAHVNVSTGKVEANYSGGTYSRSIIVGTMTDPNDAATFVPIDTVTYNEVLSQSAVATEANDYLYQQKKVALRGAVGPYIAFMSSFREKGSNATKTVNYLYLDDIAFSHRQDCAEPANLNLVMAGATLATLEWDTKNPGDAYVLQVSTNPYFADDADLVFNDTVYTNSYTVTGLQASTTYVWHVQRVCGGVNGVSEFSQKASFSTIIAPYYLEDFETTLPGDWKFYSATSEWKMENDAALINSTSYSRFSQVADGAGLPTTHYAAKCTGGNYDWMISPAIYLPAEDSVHMSMDIALTACALIDGNRSISPNAAVEADMCDDYYFLIVVSEDAGKSWKPGNVLAKWSNKEPQGHQLRDIPSDGMNVRLSLAKYAGKSVRIGFYREAKSNSTTGVAIHVDNFRLNYYDRVVDHVTGCQYEDLEIDDIFIPGDETHPGVNTYSTIHWVQDDQAKVGTHDMVNVLEAEIFAVARTAYYDTICHGETYIDLNFPSGKTETGMYPRRYQTIQGCDSVVLLNLYVIPTAYAEDSLASVCRGDSILWNGNYYKRAGLYRDTTVSSTGCDSVEILLLSYFDAEDTIFDATTVLIKELPFSYENADYPYLLGQAPIFYPVGTEPGIYKDTVMVQGVNCTATLVHTLTLQYTEGLEIVDSDHSGGARKILYRGNMYIILNDEWYNVSGQKVSNPRK